MSASPTASPLQGQIFAFQNGLSITRDVRTEGQTRSQKGTSQKCSHQQFSVGQRTHRDSGTQTHPPSQALLSPQSWRRDVKSRGTAQGLEHGILSTAWLMGLAHMLRLSVIPRCRARKTFSLLRHLCLGGKVTGAVLSPTKSPLLQQWSLVDAENTDRTLLRCRSLLLPFLLSIASPILSFPTFHPSPKHSLISVPSSHRNPLKHP